MSNISHNEAKKILDGDPKTILIDVRSPEEYKEEHIKNSISIPLDTLKDKIAIKCTDKQSNIIVYCRSGARSSNALKILSALGYKNAYNMGGIIGWPYEKER